jgi:hypothetical protein
MSYIITNLYNSTLHTPCDANPCQNGGACSVDSNNKAVCDCKGEYEGYYCTG